MLHLNKKAEIQILSGIREDEEQSLESIYSEGGVGEVKIPRLLSYILERLVKVIEVYISGSEIR
jgi:hypothetical protein